MAGRSEIEIIAIGLSAGVIALLVLAAMLGLKAIRTSGTAKFLVLAMVCVASLEASTGPLAAALPDWVRAVLRGVGIFNVAALWWLCLSLLVEGFRLRLAEWTGAAVLAAGPAAVAIGFGSRSDAAELIATFSSFVPLMMIGHVIWIAATGLSDDLVTGRRKARVAAPLVLVAAAAVSVMSEGLTDPSLAAMVRNGLATGPVAIALLVWLAGLDLGKLHFEARRDGASAPAGIDPRDTPLHAALVQAMEQDQLFQDHDLNLEKLAEHLRTPTHRLRTLINGGLGFRNFSTFLNAHRIAHAKAALADPARGRDSILVIAYESGFGVLQTFNRVFKEVEGVTPKAYRARVLGSGTVPVAPVPHAQPPGG